LKRGGRVGNIMERELVQNILYAFMKLSQWSPLVLTYGKSKIKITLQQWVPKKRYVLKSSVVIDIKFTHSIFSGGKWLNCIQWELEQN
jgi:hypothetical protein